MRSLRKGGGEEGRVTADFGYRGEENPASHAKRVFPHQKREIRALHVEGEGKIAWLKRYEKGNH